MDKENRLGNENLKLPTSTRVITLNDYSNIITALTYVLKELEDIYCYRVNVFHIVTKPNVYCPKDKIHS